MQLNVFKIVFHWEMSFVLLIIQLRRDIAVLDLIVQSMDINSDFAATKLF